MRIYHHKKFFNVLLLYSEWNRKSFFKRHKGKYLIWIHKHSIGQIDFSGANVICCLYIIVLNYDRFVPCLTQNSIRTYTCNTYYRYSLNATLRISFMWYLRLVFSIQRNPLSELHLYLKGNRKATMRYSMVFARYIEKCYRTELRGVAIKSATVSDGISVNRTSFIELSLRLVECNILSYKNIINLKIPFFPAFSWSL